MQRHDLGVAVNVRWDEARQVLELDALLALVARRARCSAGPPLADAKAPALPRQPRQPVERRGRECRQRRV